MILFSTIKTIKILIRSKKGLAGTEIAFILAALIIGGLLLAFMISTKDSSDEAGGFLSNIFGGWLNKK